MIAERNLLRSAALAAITVTTGKSVPVGAQTSADRPGFFKAKDIMQRRRHRRATVDEGGNTRSP